jgi:hypothetical protein
LSAALESALRHCQRVPTCAHQSMTRELIGGVQVGDTCRLARQLPPRCVRDMRAARTPLKWVVMGRLELHRATYPSPCTSRCRTGSSCTKPRLWQSTVTIAFLCSTEATCQWLCSTRMGTALATGACTPFSALATDACTPFSALATGACMPFSALATDACMPFSALPLVLKCTSTHACERRVRDPGAVSTPAFWPQMRDNFSSLGPLTGA